MQARRFLFEKIFLLGVNMSHRVGKNGYLIPSRIYLGNLFDYSVLYFAQVKKSGLAKLVILGHGLIFYILLGNRLYCRPYIVHVIFDSEIY
jgi:hypothetical protein